MAFEIVAGEMGVAFHDVDDDGAPGVDVAGLGFVEEDEGADDVGAETVGRRWLVSKYRRNNWLKRGQDVRYQCSLRLRAAVSALIPFIVVHPQ